MKIRSMTRGLRTLIRPWLIGALIATSLCPFAGVSPAWAQARTVSTTTHIPVAKETFNPQTNEAVHFADAEAVFRVSFDLNGGTSIDVTGHLHGAGKGMASGRGYQFTCGGQAKVNASKPPAGEFILICNGQLTVPGTRGSQPIVIVVSVTINKAGSVSAVVRELRAQPQ
jgi:hypothetical protein